MKNLFRTFVVLAFAFLAACGGGSGGDVGPAQPAETATVAQVVDGDSLILVLPETTVEARLLGIDAPELFDCYGLVATRYLEEWLLGKTVAVEYEGPEPSHDIYGRTLVYLTAPNGWSVNLEMVQSGHARAYPEFPTRMEDEIAQAQAEAQLDNLGLWAACPQNL